MTGDVIILAAAVALFSLLFAAGGAIEAWVYRDRRPTIGNERKGWGFWR